MATVVQPKLATNGRGLSPALWDFNILDEIRSHRKNGVYFFDDFHNLSQHISDQNVQQYGSYIDTGVTIQSLAEIDAAATADNEVCGICQIAGNDADNDEGVLATYGALGNISGTDSKKRPLWFEGRFRKASVADNGLGLFLGLAYDNGTLGPLTNTLCLTDDDAALGAFSFLGFHQDLANGDSLDFVYKAEGQAQTVAISGVKALVADTWYRVGFKYDPNQTAAKQIAIFIDGVEQSTYVTETQIDTATFPDDEVLGLTWCTKVGTAAESKSHLDWWAFAQLGA